MKDSTGFEPSDWAFCGIFGAAALLLPVVFHVLHLGQVFLPMYLPLFALAFVVRPFPCAMTAMLVPLLSAILTGMPPLYPPVAWMMAAELAVTTFATAWIAGRFPLWNPVFYLLPVLILGRILNAALHYIAATLMNLPAGFVAGLSFVSAWPGILLILLTVPPLARVLWKYRPARVVVSRGGDAR